MESDEQRVLSERIPIDSSTSTGCCNGLEVFAFVNLQFPVTIGVCARACVRRCMRLCMHACVRYMYGWMRASERTCVCHVICECVRACVRTCLRAGAPRCSTLSPYRPGASFMKPCNFTRNYAVYWS